MKRLQIMIEGERELLRSFEAGEWTSVPNRDEEVRRYRDHAREVVNKDRRINFETSDPTN